MRIIGIYDDRLKFLEQLGPVEVKRASHVEPYGNQWTADMSPIGGPVLGPFNTRGEALREEVEWISQNHLPSCGCASGKSTYPSNAV